MILVWYFYESRNYSPAGKGRSFISLKTFFALEKKSKERNKSTVLKEDQSRFPFEAFHFVSRWKMQIDTCCHEES